MGLEDERVLRFLPWARHFARACSAKLPPHLDHEDLQAAGILGYLRAASRYNVERGASFRGYCAPRIRGAVLDELRRWDWAPRSVHRHNRCITRVTIALSEQLEREPTAHELAAALGIDEQEWAAFQADAQPRQMISLDDVTENTNGEDNLTLKERLPDPAAVLPDARVSTEEDRRTLVACIHRLPKTQATVIVLHYLQSVPLCEVARLLDVSAARVSQIHRRAVERLRQVWAVGLESA